MRTNLTLEDWVLILNALKHTEDTSTVQKKVECIIKDIDPDALLED